MSRCEEWRLVGHNDGQRLGKVAPKDWVASWTEVAEKLLSQPDLEWSKCEHPLELDDFMRTYERYEHFDRGNYLHGWYEGLKSAALEVASTTKASESVSTNSGEKSLEIGGGMRVIVLKKFPSNCMRCQKFLPLGKTVTWLMEKGVICTDCYPILPTMTISKTPQRASLRKQKSIVFYDFEVDSQAS